MKILLVVLFCLLNVSLVLAQNTSTIPDYTINQPAVFPRVEVQGRYWIPDLEGNAIVNDRNQSTNIDFDSDLDIENENIPEARLLWHTGPYSSIRATYLRVDYGGDTNLSRTIVFDGQTYPVTSRIVSDMELQYFSLGWNWNLVHLDEDRFKAGIILEAKGIAADMSLDAPNLGISESEQFVGGAPTPGASMEYTAFNTVNLFAEITGLPAGHYGHFFDAQAGVKWIPQQNVAVTAGYRVIDVKVRYKDDRGDLQLKGPFFGVDVRF